MGMRLGRFVFPNWFSSFHFMRSGKRFLATAPRTLSVRSINDNVCEPVRSNGDDVRQSIILGRPFSRLVGWGRSESGHKYKWTKKFGFKRLAADEPSGQRNQYSSTLLYWVPCSGKIASAKTTQATVDGRWRCVFLCYIQNIRCMMLYLAVYRRRNASLPFADDVRLRFR